jgi:putative colanic acid biosynthesis acetyltransferase WcaF
MTRIRLDTFSVGNYQAGRSALHRLGWYFVGQKIFGSRLIVSYKLKTAILKLFGAQVGEGVVIKPGVRVKYPWRLSIGDHVWIGEDVWIDNLENVSIAGHACVSQGVYFCTGNHNWKVPSFDYRLSSISVGEGAWVGAKALLCPGVQVGDEAILTAGSIATKDLMPAGIYTGNPAAFVKDRWAVSSSKKEVEYAL